MSPALAHFLASLDVEPTSREEWESFDLPTLLALDPADRAAARDALIARLDAGSTDSRVVGALVALRDPAVTPALRRALDAARGRAPTGFLFTLLDVLGDDPTATCVTVLASPALDLYDVAADRLVARDADRAREALPGAIRRSILQSSRQHLFAAFVAACGVTDPDYRTPSRLASVFQRAGGWPPSLSADVADRAERLAADIAKGQVDDWVRPLARTPAFDAALAAVLNDGRPPDVTALAPSQLDYLASIALKMLPRSNRAGLDVLIGADDPITLKALRDSVGIDWMGEDVKAPLRAAIQRVEARHS
jgi:hypothetical protein